MKRWLGGLR